MRQVARWSNLQTGRKEKFVKQAEQGAVDWDALRRQHGSSCLERGDAELVTRLDCCVPGPSSYTNTCVACCMSGFE